MGGGEMVPLVWWGGANYIPLSMGIADPERVFDGFPLLEH